MTHLTSERSMRGVAARAIGISIPFDLATSVDHQIPAKIGFGLPLAVGGLLFTHALNYSFSQKGRENDDLFLQKGALDWGINLATVFLFSELQSVAEIQNPWLAGAFLLCTKMILSGLFDAATMYGKKSYNVN